MSWVLQSFKKYADFSGRSRRKEYWMFQLFTVIAALLMGFISGIDELGDLLADVPVFPMVFLLGTIIPHLSLLVRRLHDTSRSGWWLLVVLIPFVGHLYLFYLCVSESHPGENKYGPNPKTVKTRSPDTTGEVR